MSRANVSFVLSRQVPALGGQLLVSIGNGKRCGGDGEWTMDGDPLPSRRLFMFG
jgi:hypothetical protein